ncbi:hypothetical protein O6H91_20G015800 [Diphasiastrum complanatum]|uniref:Uncharacterized protein n=1 Tax=Diphasiastrum complanatum TaxID=34168 RepID=A0ACC2AN55_DIPCM|nr:hypothetical protein O6H91_20G015800 [Diphasiastrum complanatum]
MEHFFGAKTIHLRCHHGKYLCAEEDHISISQNRRANSDSAIWIVEIVKDKSVEQQPIIRLKTRFNTYLTASKTPFLLGMTGRKVLQCSRCKTDSSVEWEPISEGNWIKLKTRHGNFLRANGGVRPWKNSVTHDVPVRSKTTDWILWEVEVVETLKKSVPVSPFPPELEPLTFRTSAVPDGRLIHFTLMEDDQEYSSPGMSLSFLFKGQSLMKLNSTLKDKLETREDIIVCGRSPINNELFPLRLELPPSNSPVHLIVVKASSPGNCEGKTFSTSTIAAKK